MTNNLIRNGELVLYGTVGASLWEAGGFTADDVVSALAEMSGDIVVRLNSAGGIAFEGIAIYTALKNHAGNVTVYVDALAASAASVIAMAGDKVLMRTGSMIMIHDPSGITIGTSEEHRKNADALDQLSAAAAEIYREKTGLSEQEVLSLMDAETWMRRDEAIAKGFADGDEPSDEATMSFPRFDYSLYAHAPSAISGDMGIPAPVAGVAIAAMAAPTMENLMTTPATTPAPAPAPVPTPVPAAPAQLSAGEAIFEACLAVDLTVSEMRTVREKADGNLDRAKDEIIAVLAARGAGPETRPTAHVTADATDRFREGAEKALLAKVGLSGGERNEFSGLRLDALARHSLEMSNVRGVGGMDPMRMVGMAFTMSGGMGNSDFAHILENVANKSALKGYEEAGETFHLWTAKGFASDFKVAKRVDVGLFPSLEVVPELGEYKYGSISDSGVPVVIATYGKMFKISRQAVINDDLDMIGKTPLKMGRAARRTLGNLVYAVLNDNPNFVDGVALFHASHGNLAAAGAVPSVATFDAAETAMMEQKDDDKRAVALNITPKFILSGSKNKNAIRQILGSFADPASQNAGVINTMQNALSPIVDARIKGNAYFFAADPGVYDTVEVTYLNGVEAPYIEAKDGWSIDGTEMKIRLDAGVNLLGYRGLYKNPGPA